MKNILIINGHPDKTSFCNEIAKKYLDGAKCVNTNVKLVNLIDLNFKPILEYGFKQQIELEPDLIKIQQNINDANHLVFIYPNWWGTYPALLKGFIDRVFTPGFAFRYHKKSLFPKKLLSGKTARLIVTMDTPSLFYSLIYKKPGHNSMKKSILEFCDVKPVKITTFAPIKGSSDKKRIKWLSITKKLGIESK
jgi:NAD(P)H dehydrogenase (quinone)